MSVSVQGRDATGVRVMNLDDGQYVAAAALVQEREDEDDPSEATDVDGTSGPHPTGGDVDDHESTIVDSAEADSTDAVDGEADDTDTPTSDE
jgi:hypothetical protein